MNIKNRILQKIVKPILYRNQKFANSSKGGTCFIFGNGASLKYMDLSSLNIYPTIAVNNLFFHSQYDCLDVKYVAMPEPFNFYPIIKNTYNGFYQKNVLGIAAKKEMKRRPEIQWFISMTNILAGLPVSNTNYIHHFDQANKVQPNVNLSGIFSLMNGGMYTGLGMAMAFGFERAILVGCDYAFMPQRHRHFYGNPTEPFELADNHKISSKDFENPYQTLFEFASRNIELCVLSPFATKAHLPVLNYKNLTGATPYYRENHEIISIDNFKVLERAYSLGQLPNPV